jgi:tetratricopeptide (TPR) repeat protein
VPLVAGLALSLLGLGCAIHPALNLAEVAGGVEPVELVDVPFHPQEAHHCGPASLLTVLEASGVTTDYETVVERVYVPGLEGSLQVEMLAAARAFGRVAYTLPPEPAAVLAEVEAGRPVLVLLNLGLPRAPVWHYAVVVGFDPARNRIHLHSGREPRSHQRARSWLRRWEWAGRWSMLLLRPGEWPASPERERLLEALAAFEDTGDSAAAERAWRNAAQRWPEEVLVWLGVGNTAHLRGDRQAAVRAFRRALAIDPEHLPARLNLALTLAEDGRQCEGLEILGPAPPADHALRSAFAELETRLRGECAAR